MHRTTKVMSVLIVLVALIIIGTVGYSVLENMGIVDALYMTIITLSTVGFREVTDLTMPGQIFTILFILASLGTVAYAFTTIASFLIEGEFNRVLRRRRMEKQVANLTNHFILCGFGQTGQIVAEQFRKKKLPFLVIEQDEDKVQLLKESGDLVLEGDASTEEQLRKARIEHSQGLIACLSSDADNVFTVLTAREMNPDLYIVARAFERNAHAKLRKAGANNTISPNELGGARLAALVLKPAVVSFIDVITRVGDVDFDIEEVKITPDSQFVGKTLKDSQIREKTGFIVLAVQRRDQDKMIFNPEVSLKIHEGDKLIVLGETTKIDSLRSLSRGGLLRS